MATRNFYVTRDQKHPLYPTRMLTAGQPIPLSDSGAGLYRKMGVKLTEEKPRKAAPPAPKAKPRKKAAKKT